MPHPPLATRRAFPRERAMWSVLMALIGLQLVAFWLLCSHQVRKAEVRTATLQVQRVAVADCLRYIPRATLTSCVNRVDPTSRFDAAPMLANDTPGAGRTTMGAAPVNVSYR
jgi:hypothetical protein